MLRLMMIVLSVACLMWTARAADETGLSALSPEEQEIVATLQTSGVNAQSTKNAIEFWRKAPENLKARILAAPKEKRWPIILCNFLGFNIGDTGRTDPEACEVPAYADIQRGQESWSDDGKWVGPSDECRARNKRNGYGQLICG